MTNAAITADLVVGEVKVKQPALTDSPLMRVSGIRKRFGGVTALDGVDLDLRAGEVHALLGENGAGKSTLIKILGGVYQPDQGEVRIGGTSVKVTDVATADRLGIRLIHQELALAPNLTVAENIFLGREPSRYCLLDRNQLFRDAAALCRGLGLQEISDVRVLVRELSVAQQQMVEIARALSIKARVLVLDEPTASLSEAETERLFAKLCQLRSQGVGIIYISHRLEEIQRIADRITVLRDGRSVGTQHAANVDTTELIRWMVGRELRNHYPRSESRSGSVALRVRNLRGRRVHGVSFDIRYGEILGFAGLVGSGRTDLAQTLFGIEPAWSGEITVDGKPVVIRTPAEALAAGLALVPEDRKREGLVMGQSVAYNLALPWVNHWLHGCMPNEGRRGEIVMRAVRNFAIKTSDVNETVSSLSGGNQQKVVVGRWMEKPPKILILDEPTRGVDVGAREEMFGIIHRFVDEGMAVLLISSDLPEVMNLSHRLALYRNGRIARDVPAGEITAEEVMAELTQS
jgi:ABC-type sugar transport system ATPase subunit